MSVTIPDEVRKDDGVTNTAMDGSLAAAAFLDRVPNLDQPEKRLMLAVLEGAVSDFQKYATAATGRGRRLFADAEAWLASGVADRPLDFESVCHALGLAPEFIRAGLRRWCVARRGEAGPSRRVLHFPFRRVSGGRHVISPHRGRGVVTRHVEAPTS
jgi:hypothetical protein